VRAGRKPRLPKPEEEPKKLLESLVEPLVEPLVERACKGRADPAEAAAMLDVMAEALFVHSPGSDGGLSSQTMDIHQHWLDRAQARLLAAPNHRRP